MKAVLLTLPLALAACATVPPAGPLTGSWGGQHVGLRLDPAGGALDYDCAAGRIDQPLVADGGGRFVANGSHTPGSGGPDRAGVTPPSYPARYSGVVRGEMMTLTVDVAAIGARIGPYRLRRGAEPVLMRCL